MTFAQNLKKEEKELELYRIWQKALKVSDTFDKHVGDAVEEHFGMPLPRERKYRYVKGLVTKLKNLYEKAKSIDPEHKYTLLTKELYDYARDEFQEIEDFIFKTET